MEYRRAETRDALALAKLRRRQLIDEGQIPSSDISAALEDFFRRKLESGELIQWVAEEAGVIIATGAVMFMEFPPNFIVSHCLGAYITNMYTAPEHRRRGIATALLEKLEQEARTAGASRMWLGASDMGRTVYAKFGFEPYQTQMKKELDR